MDGYRPGRNRAILEWQLDNHTKPVRYCKVCYWSTTEPQNFCAYGHGKLHPISEFHKELLEDL